MNKEWKIIKILNDYKIVINGGTNDLLKRDDELEIFTKGEEVFDPDTNESLGSLDGIKAYVTIVDIFEKMSVCENSETSISNPLISPFQNFNSYESKRLNVDPSEITGIPKHSNKIKIGDLVRKTL